MAKHINIVVAMVESLCQHLLKNYLRCAYGPGPLLPLNPALGFSTYLHSTMGKTIKFGGAAYDKSACTTDKQHGTILCTKERKKF